MLGDIAPQHAAVEVQDLEHQVADKAEWQPRFLGGPRCRRERDRTGCGRRHRQGHCHRFGIVSRAGDSSRDAWRIVIRPFQGSPCYFDRMAVPLDEGAPDRRRFGPFLIEEGAGALLAGAAIVALFAALFILAVAMRPAYPEPDPGVSSGNSAALPARHSAEES